jgi:hypothetical protein
MLLCYWEMLTRVVETVAGSAKTNPQEPAKYSTLIKPTRLPLLEKVHF